MTDIRKGLCPFPEKVYLGSSHIKQNINGHEQIVGMFITDKPDGGDYYKYTRAHDVEGLIAEIYHELCFDCVQAVNLESIIRKHFWRNSYER